MLKKFYAEGEKPKRFYSVKEASKILGVSTNTIYKYLDAGSLKGKRFNDRGRFKIPYSEIEPYLAREIPAATTEIIQENTQEEVPEKTQVIRKSGSNFAYFETLGLSLVGLLVIYTLWSFSKSTTVSQSTFLTDIGSAVLAYSGRTFSGFGNLISHVLPAQKTTNITHVSNEEVKEPGAVAAITDSKEDIPDFNLKLQESQRKSYELYADAQVLASNTQKLLSQSRTLTAVELNESINGMSQLLGSVSDSPDQKTIFAEINYLDEAWSFPAVEAIKRSASQVSFILDSLNQKSLGAFTKPQPADLNDLVSQTEELQGLVGSDSDSSTNKTLYGNIKGVEILAKTIDAKSKEIDNILASWDSYSTSEKQNSVKTILSETLSINTLPKIDETVFSKPGGLDQDTELKNTLLSIKGILEANKIHLAQKTGDPVVVIWLESGGDVKMLVANPSALTSQEVAIKYYLSVGVDREQVGQIDGGFNLSFDSLRHQYYVEGSPILAAGEIKTISLRVGGIKPVADAQVSDKVAEVKVSPKAPEVVTTPSQSVVLGTKTMPVTKSTPVPQVAAVSTQVIPTEPTPTPISYSAVVAGTSVLTSDVQRIIGAGISFLALATLVVYLLTLFIKREKKPKVQQTTRPGIKIGSIITRIILPIKTVILSILSFPIKTILLIATGLKKLILFVIKISSSIFRFLMKILYSIKKFLTSLINGLYRVVVAVVMFPVKVIRAAVSVTVSFFRKIWFFVTSVVISVVKTLVSIKTFIFKIPGAILIFILKVISLVKKFFISQATGFYKLVTSVIHAIRKAIVSVKTGILTILTSGASFFVKILSLTKKLVVSIITGLVNFTIAIVTSLQNGLRAIARAITKFLVSIKVGLIAILVSVTTFFSKLLTSITKFFISLVTGFVKFVASIIASLGRAFRAVSSAFKRFFVNIISAIRTFFVSTANAFKTFFVGIASAVRKIPVAIKAGLVAILVSIVTFLAKLLASIKIFFISLVKGFAGIIISFTGSLKRGFLAVYYAIKAFFLGILSAIRKLLISIKSGILTILTSIVAFFLRIVTSVKNFIISIVTGVVKLTISLVNSFGRGFGAFKRAINTFFVKITSAVAAFFVNIAAEITKTIITIKNAILRMIVSVKTFFLKVLSTTLKLVFSIVTGLVNFITAIVTSLKNGFRAVIRAIKTFFVNIVSAATALIASVVSAIVKTITSIKRVILAVLTSIKAFFLKVLSTTLKLVFSIVTGLVNFIAAVIASLKKGINIIINAVITLLANVISAVTNAVISVMTALQKVAISMTTFFLKILSKVVKAVVSIIRSLLKILTSIAKFTDSNLNQLDFKTPTIRKSHSNFRSTATFLLIGVIYTTILGVLVFKVIPLVKADSRGILGKETIGSNEEMKIDGPVGESTVLINVR